MTEGDNLTPATSVRQPGRGFATLLISVYGVFALAASARSAVQMLRDFDRAPVAYLLSLAAALTYIAATVLLAGRRGPSRAARLVCIIELIGVVTVGTLTLLDPDLFPDATVWSLYGIGYGFVPLILPVVAIVYLSRRNASNHPRHSEAPTATVEDS
nr:hypothetical protein [Devriesea agamarum]